LFYRYNKNISSWYFIQKKLYKITLLKFTFPSLQLSLLLRLHSLIWFSNTCNFRRFLCSRSRRTFFFNYRLHSSLSGNFFFFFYLNFIFLSSVSCIREKLKTIIHSAWNLKLYKLLQIALSFSWMPWFLFILI